MDNNYFDFIVVGAGLFGAAFASTASSLGKKVLVIDKNNHVGGACYTEMVDGVTISVALTYSTPTTQSYGSGFNHLENLNPL